MTDRAQALLRDALTLPPGDRAGLAAELLASLDDPGVDDPVVARALWRQEFERRARRALADESGGEDWNDVRDRVGRQLTEG